MSTNPLSDPQLPGLVQSALEMWDEGIEPCFEVICSERPDLQKAVEDSVRISRQLPTLRRESALLDRLVGRLIANRYELKVRLGAGAMGVVYLATDQELGRSVAIKILRSEFLDELESEHRFSREAEALAAVRHDSVVTIFDRGRTAEDDPYIVMELLEGQPLNKILEEGRRISSHGVPASGWIAKHLDTEDLDEPSYIRTVVSWAADLASGLAATHQSGIYHRDVKPSNVFIRRNGRPVLLDFGIAAQVSQATITREDATLGTPAYMAPETLEADSRPNESVDIYGLAATLYHMLTLRSPYEGSPTQILTQLATKDPVVASKANPGLPKDLQAILDRGMSRRISNRYQTASEFESDLRAFLDYRPVKARAVTPLSRVRQRLFRSQAFVAGASVAGLALLSVGAYLGWGVWVSHRSKAHMDLWQHLPPNVTIISPSSRTMSMEAGRGELEDLLDEAASTCVDVLPTYLIRGAFRLDHGDQEGAAQDLDRVAASVGTEYARGLAALYASAPEGALEIDCSSLGEPEDERDVYLAAFHAMRAQDTGRAESLLQDPRLSDYLPARELRLLFLSKDPTRMFEEAVSIEDSLGRRTANTAYLMGLSLIWLRHYGKAHQVLEEGVALAPKSSRLRVNAAKAAERVGQVQTAREHLEYAIRMDPNYWRPYVNLTRLLVDQGDLSGASRVLLSAPPGLDEGMKEPRPMLEGEIETERAIIQYASGQFDKSIQSAKVALKRFQEAAELPRYKKNARAAMSQALATGDQGAVLEALANLVVEDPLHWRRLNILVDWVPEDSSEPNSIFLKDVLQSISEELAARGQQSVSEN